METIYSDGKTLEIERKLNITVFLPQLCYFCGELITKFGRESDSLCFHSLDGDHDNWDPSNKVPTHRGCHITFHNKNGVHPMSNPEIAGKIWQARRERYGPSGAKDPEAWGKAISEGMMKKSPEERAEASKKTWKTRRERYGPTGRKPKEGS